MKYLYWDLNLGTNEVVRVTLRGHAANVMLLDPNAYANYRAGRSYRYYGGYYARAPVFLHPPNPGHWYLVINLGGYDGHVDAAVNVLSTHRSISTA